MSNAAFKNLKQNLLKIQGWELEKFMRKNTKKNQKSTKNPKRKKKQRKSKKHKKYNKNWEFPPLVENETFATDFICHV